MTSVPSTSITESKIYFLVWKIGDLWRLWMIPKEVTPMSLNQEVPYAANKKLVKCLHPIIFVSNIFPNSHLIQKCIHNQQLFWNSCWLCIHIWIKWELGKIFDTNMIGWSHFRSAYLLPNSSERIMLISYCQSQFSMSKIIRIFFIFFIEEYQFRDMFFVICIF